MGLYQRGALETEANTETYSSTPSKPFSRLFSSILLSLQTGIDVGYFLAFRSPISDRWWQWNETRGNRWWSHQNRWGTDADSLSSQTTAFFCPANSQTALWIDNNLWSWMTSVVQTCHFNCFDMNVLAPCHMWTFESHILLFFWDASSQRFRARGQQF